MSGDALENLVHAVATAKQSDPLAPVTVLVPNNLSARTLGWRLADGLGDGRRAVAGLHITTPARLAESLAAVNLHPRRPLLPSVLAAAWRSQLAASTDRPEWPFATVWEHPATVRALVRTYRDWREVPAGGLANDELSNVTQETLRLAARVRQHLSADWYDQQDLYAVATDLVSTAPETLASAGDIISYLLDEASYSARCFLTVLDQHSFTVTVDDDSGARTADRVLHASDSDDEVRAVVRQVVAALAEQQPARRLAIGYTRADPYVRLLHAHLAAAGVEFNGRGALPILERASARAFLGVLALPRRQFPRAELFHVLADWPLRQFGSDRQIPTSWWERISREANIAGAEPVDSGWLSRLDVYVRELRQAATFDSDTSRARKDRDIEQALELREFVRILEGRLSELETAANWAVVADLCSALLDDLFGEITDIKQWETEEKRALATLRSVITGLRSLDSYRPPTGTQDVLDVLTTELASAVPRTGKFGRGIFVGPISQARGLDLDQIWVVGLAEDLYPGRQSEDALLPDRLRAATEGLHSAGDRVARLSDDLTAAFAAAAQVTASFPRGDLRASTQKLPSRLLLPSLRKLVGEPTLAATRWQEAAPSAAVTDVPSFAAGVVTSARPATEQEWSLRQVLAVGDAFEDATFQTGRHLQRHRASPAFTRFDGNLSGVTGLPRFADGELLLSSTALESYARCPFAYFVHRLLYVQPVEEPSALAHASPLTIGNIFHFAMDRFLQAQLAAASMPAAGQKWDEEHFTALTDYAAEVIADFEASGHLGHPTLWQAQADKIQQNVRQMLIDDNTWRVDEGAQTVSSELAFGRDDLPAAVVPVAGGQVLFRGSADKIDRAGDVIHITDIKTGKSDSYQQIQPRRGTPNRLADGTRLQLPVYAHAALQAYPDATHARAHYWFVHGESTGKRIALDLDDDLHQQFSHVVGTLVDGIARGYFFKKPSKDPGWSWVDCEFCTPGGIGHAAIRRDYETKRRNDELIDLLRIIDPQAVEA